jgi:Fe-S-cluster-containing dehydrogenase component
MKDELTPDLTRRDFIQWMSALSALLTTTGCIRQPLEKVIPYAKEPERIIPGRPLFFATAMPWDGYGIGILAESHMGRPTKLEGNESHPASLGSSDAVTQAAILGLYDPDRSQSYTFNDKIVPWKRIVSQIKYNVDTAGGKGPGSVRLLTSTVTSPSLADQIETLLKNDPRYRWHQHQPVSRDNAKAGSQMSFGAIYDANYNLARANTLVSFDCDFLSSLAGRLRYSRDWSQRRQGGYKGHSLPMNRMYVVESSPSLVGGVADHRIDVAPSEVAKYLIAVAKGLGLQVPDRGEIPAAHQSFVSGVIADLKKSGGESLVLVGESQPAALHALAHAINETLGSVDKTVFYSEPVEARPTLQDNDFKELVADMNAGKVDALIIMGVNPVYTSPADLEFAHAMSKVRFKVHHGLYKDETAALCDYHVPAAHFLESWGDIRAYDGTASLIQPLIAPLYDGKSNSEFVAALNSDSTTKNYDLVKNYWKKAKPAVDFEKQWSRWLHDGVIPGTAAAAKRPKLAAGALSKIGGAIPAATENAGKVEIAFRPDPSIWDGQFTNNGWLQELPKPFTKMTWDNVALFHPNTMKKMGFAHGDVIEIVSQGRKVRAPVWSAQNHPANSVTLYFGYGRSKAGRIAGTLGYNAYLVRASNAMWATSEAQIKKVAGESYPLAPTHGHQAMEGRDIVRWGQVSEYLKNPDFLSKEKFTGPFHQVSIPADPSTFPPETRNEYQWGMSINLNSCTGCNACVVACQSENNIPIVGKDQVAREREMHWIRIDTYYDEEKKDEIHFQPVPCMHCETAPCEVVCPVAATTHSHEGLNQMVYNRCVGTRYCSNNCPYKVRRFNFYNYDTDPVPQIQMARNPDVTVRDRGVMEKCTFCIQRINSARIDAEKEGRLVRDGEIKTACQQSCPTQAIVFGNLRDEKSEVYQAKSRSLNYSLLGELNTRPRTTYLAKLKNSNPEVKST